MEPEIHELTAGYALDALDPSERSAYEAHLLGCERCQADLTSFWKATEALAVAASGPAPRAELRERILAEARAERQVVVPLEPRRRRALPVLAGAAAVAAAAALGIGIWASDLSNQLDESRSALERERATAAVLADPTARAVALQAGDGRLVVTEAGAAVLVLAGVDSAPSDKTYQVWIVAGDTPASAGLFDGEDAVDLVLVEGVVDSGAVVAVTLERAGGADAPTTDPIVASDPI